MPRESFVASQNCWEGSVFVQLRRSPGNVFIMTGEGCNSPVTRNSVPIEPVASRSLC